MTLLSLKDVTKAYGGVPALKGVDLAIAPGEIHALMGENGAGKSTLIKILAGVVHPDTAEIRIDDVPVEIGSPRQAHRLGLRFIHQEFNVVPALSGCTTPARILIRVDLPAPFSPISAWISPGAMLRSTPLSAGTPP